MLKSIKAMRSQLISARAFLEADQKQPADEILSLLQRRLEVVEKRYDLLLQKLKVDERSGVLRYDERTIRRFHQKHQCEGRKLYYARFDLDRFSDINKEKGHGFGDKVIRLFGQFLEQIFPAKQPCLVMRYGGDEFDVLISSPKSLEVIKDEVVKKLEAFRERQGVDASLGLTEMSSLPLGKGELERLQKRVDEALFLHKESKTDKIKNS